jgi:hypothetical protein
LRQAQEARLSALALASRLAALDRSGNTRSESPEA